MVPAESLLARPPQQSRIPLVVKLAYTLFLCILVPIYLRDYGWTNFLYYCDVALLMTLVAVWREEPLWVSMPAVGILLPQAFWMLDFLGRCIELPFCTMTEYMFDPSRSRFTRGLSLFHFWLPIFLVWLLWRLGYDRRAVFRWSGLAWVLMLVCYFCMPAPSPDITDRDLPVNINYVYGMSGQQEWMHPLAYLGLLLVALPVCVYVPTHLVLRTVFRDARATDDCPLPPSAS